MSSPVLPRLDPNAIKKLVRTHAPSYLLYHAGPEWFSEQYNGTWYHFPPDLGPGVMVAHPSLRDENGESIMVEANGTLKVADRYGIIYGDKAEAVAGIGFTRPIKDPEGKIEVETADKVVQFFTKKFGVDAESPVMALGITMLTGDETVDAEIKKVSRKMWTEAHRAWAEQERSGRLEFISKWKAQNPGRTDFPPMNARQRRAEEILLAAEEDKVESPFRFVCECGGCETDKESVYDQHLRMRHPDWLREAAEEAKAAGALPPLPVKRPRGRPRKYPLPAAPEAPQT